MNDNFEASVRYPSLIRELSVHNLGKVKLDERVARIFFFQFIVMKLYFIRKMYIRTDFATDLGSTSTFSGH